METTALPLQGIRVLELCTGAAGPTVGKSLVEYGAEVLRIESRVRADSHRGGSDYPERWNKRPDFVKLARGKKSVTVNLQTQRGRELVLDLVRVSDVFVENFSLGVVKRWGLDYDRLRSVNPRIIMISLKGLGNTGPHAPHVTWGPNLLCLFGITHLWNQPDSPVPTQEARIQHPDFMAGVAGASAVVAALLYRARTGKGQYIDSAQMEVGASLLGPYYLDYIVNGRDPSPVGNLRPGAAPHGVYPCAGKDQWCVISVEEQEEWKRFCTVAGHPEWECDERFSTPLSRERHRSALDEAVATWTRALTGPEVMERLQAVGIAAAHVQDVEDQILRDPQYRERGFFVELDEPEMGPILTEYPAARLSETPAQVRTPAPLMGEHTDQIMREVLHLSDAEIEALKTEGVLN